LRRLDEEAEITLVERGPYISFANCGLPYHLGGVISQRDALLVQTVDGFTQRFNVEVLAETEAVAIDRERRVLHLRSPKGDLERPYDALVLSPGAEPIRPPLPGVDLPGVHVLRNIPDLDGIMSLLARQPRRCAVIGGGFIGVEVAENLAHRRLPVTLVEMAPQVMPLMDPEMAAPLQQELTRRGVKVRTGTALQGIEQAAGQAGLVVQVDQGQSIEADLVVLAIGVRPEVDLARRADLALGSTGAIKVDAQLRTSDPHIYAVGDAIEVEHRPTGLVTRVPLAGPANRQGRLAADAIVGRHVTYRGALGTSIIKVFSLAGGSVGLSEKAARQQGIAHQAAWLYGASHAGYYPGAAMVALKILFDPQTGRLLGAQAVGGDGVDKRIDVLATAILGRMTVYDLEELDLAYAPPFSSAKDPVNHAGTIAAGMLRGDHPSIRWDEVDRARQRGAFFLDVRQPEELKIGTLPGALNIPLPELRRRLSELPRDREIIVNCQIGLRGYLAARILLQRGYSARNLLGGFILWHVSRDCEPLS
jgi:NADPH-dependent 2,4-dienoyl-CoA reductase/sulfur reductase-like enzyme/rhodanese-related sulfurtransferase